MSRLLQLPNELLLKTLTPLPAADVLHLRRVSRQLRTLIDDPKNYRDLARASIVKSRTRIRETVRTLFDLPTDDPTTLISTMQAYFRNRGIRAPTHSEFSEECMSLGRLLAWKYGSWPGLGQVHMVQTLVALHFQLYGAPEAPLGWHYVADSSQFLQQFSRLGVNHPSGLKPEDLVALYDRIISTPGGLFADASVVQSQGSGEPRYYVSRMRSPFPQTLPPSNRLFSFCDASEVSSMLNLPILRLLNIFSYYTKSGWAHSKLRDVINHHRTPSLLVLAAVLEDLYIY